jgi:uncharacterized protein
MSAHEFTIAASDLDAGGRAYRFPVKPAWLRAQLEDHEAKPADKDGILDVRASKSGNDVVVSGKLDADLSVPCARCTEPFPLHVHAEVRVLYAPASKVKTPDEKDYEFSSEEADTLPYDGETVVLDDLVRDELLLEIPMIPLCSEGCPGMSTAPKASEKTAEKGAGIDPRLAPLLGFRAVKNSKA